MARTPGQVLMFNDHELSLIKNTFADNEEYLYAIRKVLLQFPLTEVEKTMVRTLTTPAVWAVVKKRIHPDIDPDAPFFQLADLYQSLSNDLNSKGPEEMAPRLEAKRVQIEYLDQQFEALKDIDNALPPKIVLDRLKNISTNRAELYDSFIGNLSRNHLLGWVDSALNQLKILAGKKEETIEETKKRLERDSTK